MSRAQPAERKHSIIGVSFRSRLTINERLIREQDRDRAKELARLTGFGIALLLPLLLYVWQQVTFVETAYQVEALQREREELQGLLRKARMERASLEAPHRIERLARARLGLVQPHPEEVVVIEIADADEPGTESPARGAP